MMIDLSKDVQLRGAVFEYACKILLRRMQSNNFIFLCKDFDSVQDIIEKYRLEISGCQHIIDFLRRNKCRTDIVEFKLNNTAERKVSGIAFYEVKTRRYDTQRNYYESCISNHEFMLKMKADFQAECNVVSIMIYPDWRFSFNIYDYEDVLIRVYDSVSKKTCFFKKL